MIILYACTPPGRRVSGYIVRPCRRTAVGRSRGSSVAGPWMSSSTGTSCARASRSSSSSEGRRCPDSSRESVLTEIYARGLLVATGARDELPEVPGMAEQWGTGVIHCPYCHGWEVRDRRIGVLATARWPCTRH